MNPDQVQHSRVKQLNSKKLPVLPPGATYLLKSLTEDSMDFNALAEIVERFPSIAARLIGLANSAWSSPVNQISSIEMACSRLGLNVVRSLSIALAVASPFDAVKCPKFDVERFWYNALMSAEVSFMLANRVETGHDASTARSAGLLHNLGLLLIVDQYPEELNEAFLLVEQQKNSSLQQALIAEFGFDASDAGKILGENWGLPEPLVITMAHFQDKNYQGSDDKLVGLVSCAVEIVSAHTDDLALEVSETRLKQMALKVDDLEALYGGVIRHGKKMKELAKVLFKA